MMRIIFSKYAKQEIEDAVSYYEREYSGLGKRFKEEVRIASFRIAEYPQAWSTERGDVRKCLLHTKEFISKASFCTIEWLI